MKLPGDNEDDYEPEMLPSCWMDDEEVESLNVSYSTRSPTDWVISGPLPEGAGPGRRFDSWKVAERWAREFYGDRYKGRIREAANEGCNRWSFLLKAK
jgi:hypothetical protein